jgi:DNA repair photolyase
MVIEITAKTILNHVKQPDTWFGLKYNMNLYRGCQHQCIYCDSRSECYRLGDLAEIRVKTNALELLEDALPRKRMRGTIGFGSMNDLYMPIEKKYRLARGALEIINHHSFPVHILTKSDLVLRDLDILQEIQKTYAAVSFTVTTVDDDLAAKIEPGAPPPSARFQAIRKLSRAGILTGVTMMPILPFLEDDPENIQQIVRAAGDNGASYIIPAFGMTLRPGSREYYYKKLDQHFPGVKEKYIQRYGNSYQLNASNWRQLDDIFYKEINQRKISSAVPVFVPEPQAGKNKQMPLFED